MAKMALHGMKLGKGNIVGMERHNERKNKEYSNPDIDQTKSAENYELKKSPESYYRAVMDLVDTRNNTTGTALRKDAKVACEFVFSSSHEYLLSLSSSEQRRLFQTAHDYLSKQFGEKNVVYSKVHMDEHTPHLHFGFVPLASDERLCAKEVVNRAVLFKLQKELPQVLGSAGFDIQRGEENSKAKHLSVAEYKHQAEEQKRGELLKEIASLEQNKKELLGSIKHAKTIENIPMKKSLTGDKTTLNSADLDNLIALAKRTTTVNSENKKLREHIKSSEGKESLKIHFLEAEIKSLKLQLAKPAQAIELVKKITDRSLER